MTLTQLVTVLKTPLCILLLTVVYKFQSERGAHMHLPAPPLPTGLIHYYFLVYIHIHMYMILFIYTIAYYWWDSEGSTLLEGCRG